MPTRAARLLLLLALGMAAGCASDQGVLQVVGTGPADLAPRLGDTTTAPVKRGVVGRDTRVTSVLLVPTFTAPRLERAVQDALAQGGGDTLVGARVRAIDRWFLLGWSTLEVTGSVVDSRTFGAPR